MRNTDAKLTPSQEKEFRNQEILMEIATGAPKEDVRKKYRISLTQLNRILREADAETEAWYKSLPKKILIQIFCSTSSKLFHEIRRLEHIRNAVKNDPRLEFEMTSRIIHAYSNYYRMIGDGPSLLLAKEIVEAEERSKGKNSN